MSGNTERAQELLDLVSAAETLVRNRHRCLVRGDDHHAQADPRAIVLQEIQYDLVEAVTALGMIRDRLLEIRDVWRSRLAHIRRVGPGRHTLPRKQERELIRGRRAALEVEILLKAVYQYLYGIEELLKAPEVQGVVGSPLEHQLKALTAYRHHSLTHKRGAKVFRRGGRLNHAENLEQSFGSAALAAGDSSSMIRDVANFWSRAQSAEGADLPEEGNVYVRLELLHQHQTRLPEHLRGEVKSLFKKYGVDSHAPHDLARMVLALCQVFLDERFAGGIQGLGERHRAGE